MNLITISPGHYGNGTGSSDLLDEVTEARKVTNRIVELLRGRKIGVTKIEDNSSKNQKQNLNYLVSKHNRTTRKLDVSIHFNATSKRVSNGIGTEVLYLDEDTKKLAENLSKAISSASGLKNRGGKKRTDLAFLNKTEKPAILIEVCFVNSITDVQLYKNHFDGICQAITNIIIEYAGKGNRPQIDTSVSSLKQITNKGVIVDPMTSQTLINKINELISKKAFVRNILQYGVSEKLIHEVWLEKEQENALSTADILGLSLLMLVKENEKNML